MGTGDALGSLKLQQLVKDFNWQYGDAHRAMPDTRHRRSLATRQGRLAPRRCGPYPPEPLPGRWWRPRSLPPEILHIDRLIQEGGTALWLSLRVVAVNVPFDLGVMR